MVRRTTVRERQGDRVEKPPEHSGHFSPKEILNIRKYKAYSERFLSCCPSPRLPSPSRNKDRTSGLPTWPTKPKNLSLINPTLFIPNNFAHKSNLLFLSNFIRYIFFFLCPYFPNEQNKPALFSFFFFFFLNLETLIASLPSNEAVELLTVVQAHGLGFLLKPVVSVQLAQVGQV